MSRGRTCSRGHAFQGEEPCPVCWPGYRTFKMRARVWLYQGDAAWHFVTVPKKESGLMKERFGLSARGWGSLRVQAAIGTTSWRTSIFPDKKTGQYLLPLKAAVRKDESISVDDTVTLTLEILA